MKKTEKPEKDRKVHNPHPRKKIGTKTEKIGRKTEKMKQRSAHRYPPSVDIIH